LCSHSVHKGINKIIASFYIFRIRKLNFKKYFSRDTWQWKNCLVLVLSKFKCFAMNHCGFKR
jgi:hypothetical protein